MTVFSAAAFDHHESVYFHHHADSGLRAIIAIHNSRLGPATGGCRMFPYVSDQQALDDVLRLSRGMSLKSALAGLPLGGGKAVILGDPRRDKTPQLLRAMAEFIDELGGRYISAEDSGIGLGDLSVMAQFTPHLAGIQAADGGTGDPSPYTAAGVFLGIQTAVSRHLQRDNLAGLEVAVQGAGAVGLALIRRLLAVGARVWVSDVQPDNLAAAVKLGAQPVAVDEILRLPVDVLAPCAMGSVLAMADVGRLRAKIIAGAANNQLAEPGVDAALHRQGILYAPDFVINAGGIIKVHYDRIGLDDPSCRRHIADIPITLGRVFDLLDADVSGAEQAAEQLALAQLTAVSASAGGPRFT